MRFILLYVEGGFLNPITSIVCNTWPCKVVCGKGERGVDHIADIAGEIETGKSMVATERGFV